MVTRSVKLSDHAVVRLGICVKEEEANNQRRAYELVDHNFVRIPINSLPLLHQGATRLSSYGVYMPGRVLEPVEDPALITRIAYVLAHLANIRRSIPGPTWWLECRVASFGLKAKHLFPLPLRDMEIWFNRRLSKQEPKLVLDRCNLVLCHLDIAPRNLLLLQGRFPLSS